MVTITDLHGDDVDEATFIRLLLDKRGIGDGTIARLDDEFDTTAEVACASLSRLKSIDGIGKTTARKIRTSARAAGAPRVDSPFLPKELREKTLKRRRVRR
jgi:ERCC4-type nuclease